jgi:hypothetical protein
VGVVELVLLLAAGGFAGVIGIEAVRNHLRHRPRPEKPVPTVTVEGTVVADEKLVAPLTETPVVGYTLWIEGVYEGNLIPRHSAKVSQLTDFYVDDGKERTLIRHQGAELSRGKDVELTSHQLGGMPSPALREVLERNLYNVGELFGQTQIDGRELCLKAGSWVQVEGVASRELDPTQAAVGYRSPPMVQVLTRARITVLDTQGS